MPLPTNWATPISLGSRELQDRPQSLDPWWESMLCSGLINEMEEFYPFNYRPRDNVKGFIYMPGSAKKMATEEGSSLLEGDKPSCREDRHNTAMDKMSKTWLHEVMCFTGKKAWTTHRFSHTMPLTGKLNTGVCSSSDTGQGHSSPQEGWPHRHQWPADSQNHCWQHGKTHKHTCSIWAAGEDCYWLMTWVSRWPHLSFIWSFC